MLVDYLEFQINDDIAVQTDFDIKNKCLVSDGCAKFSGIGDFHGTNFFGSKMQQGRFCTEVFYVKDFVEKQEL